MTLALLLMMVFLFFVVGAFVDVDGVFAVDDSLVG